MNLIFKSQWVTYYSLAPLLLKRKIQYNIGLAKRPTFQRPTFIMPTKRENGRAVETGTFRRFRCLFSEKIRGIDSVFSEKAIPLLKNIAMYLHERKDWWRFRYDNEKVLNLLGEVRAKQGLMLGRMTSLGFNFQDDAMLTTMSLELVRSSEIEGESLDLSEVRSSIARRLGIDSAGLIPSSRYVEGVVEMLLDTTQNYDKPLSDERLFGWHNVLFPTGRSGLYEIEVGKYRSGEMQVISGAMGREHVHYQAPKPERLKEEMAIFIHWFNGKSDLDAVMKAAIAHLWFVSIHPFDDGNGRITRALTDMLLARSESSSRRFYSMSSEIKLMQKEYYEVLERTQKGDGDITEWIVWFLQCFEKAITSTESTLSSIIEKNKFWEQNKGIPFNERQHKIINMLFDNFFGKLTSSKWAKIAKCSPDTALNDIHDLVAKGILIKNEEGGRSTNYSLVK
jgi:Fic family protein